MASGRGRIAEHFCLMGLVPGEVWDELGEVSESEDYRTLRIQARLSMRRSMLKLYWGFADGNQSLLFSHTVTFSLLPSVTGATSAAHRSRSYASFTSFPSTPFFGRTPHESPILAPTNLPPGASTPREWPIRTALSYIHPRVILAALTTVHIRILTTLKFNEVGRIVHHEDTWGIKEVVEGVLPILSPLYFLERRGFGAVAGTFSRAFLMRGAHEADEEAARLDAQGRSTRAGSPMTSRKPSMAGLALDGTEEYDEDQDGHHYHATSAMRTTTDSDDGY